jgi:CcmD family protein
MSGLLVDEVTAIFVVMAVTLVVWLGIFVYLWGLDRKVKRLEKEVRRAGNE